MSNSQNKLELTLDKRAMILRQRILKYKLADIEQIKGCSELEIAKLGQAYGLYLPYSYKVFMRHFGHGFAPIGNEYEYLYQAALSLTQNERDIEQEIKEEGNFNPEEILPEQAFVFAMRQGMQLWYFIAEEGVEDPPVFYDADGGGNAIEMYESIFDFWEERIT